MASQKPMRTIESIAQLLATRNLSEFVGLKEDQWFDAKKAPAYDLATAPGRFELAKDVSSFANASGGHLFLGLTAERDGNGKPTGAPGAAPGPRYPTFWRSDSCTAISP